MFSAKPVGADVGTVTVTPSPAKARSIAQYTILVTSASSQGALSVDTDSITVTFNTKTGVPASMATSSVKIKANAITGAGTANQSVSVQAVTISGRAVTLTIPDMDPATGTGDNGIAANSGITITFTQAAGIQNPNLAKATYTATVKSSQDTTAVISTAYEITKFVSFTPSTAARGATVTVTGGGFTANCTTCKIHLNGAVDEANLRNSKTGILDPIPTVPTTGAFGSGTIDANGVFTGTITLSSSTSSGGYAWVIDSAGVAEGSTTRFVQKAGATPRVTSASPMQKVQTLEVLLLL
jgi:hypothetical protein